MGEPRGSPFSLRARLRLEHQPQAELNVPTVKRRSVKLVARRNSAPGFYLARSQQIAVGVGVEVGVIEQVEELRAELKTRTLPGELEILQNCGVEVPVAGCPERIAGQEQPCGLVEVELLRADAGIWGACTESSKVR